MKRSILASAAILIAPLALPAADPFNDGFADKRLEAYIENTGRLYEDASFKEAPGMSGKKCIAFTFDNEVEAEFHPVPVDCSRAYALSFRGRWENSETYDNNPTFEAAVGETWRLALTCVPTMTLLFLDAEGKPIKDEIFMTLPHGAWRQYKHVFFPPTGASFMKLKNRSGRNLGVYYVDNIKFGPVTSATDETTLCFVDGKEEYSGSVYGVRILPSSLCVGGDGRRMINSGYGSCTSPIILPGPGTYRLAFKGEIARGKGFASLAVHFIDATGKKIGEAASQKLDAGPLEFTLPKESTTIKLLIYNHLMEEIKITKLKP